MAQGVQLSRRHAVIHTLPALRTGTPLPTDNDSEFGWFLRRLYVEQRAARRLAGGWPDEDVALIDRRVTAGHALLTALRMPPWYGLATVLRGRVAHGADLAVLRAEVAADMSPGR